MADGIGCDYIVGDWDTGELVAGIRAWYGSGRNLAGPRRRARRRIDITDGPLLSTRSGRPT